MRNKVITLAIACSLSMQVQATDYTALKLLEIQSETAYLKAQTELAKARNDLAAAQGVTSSSPKNIPQVVSIIRFGDDVTARLRLSDGAPIEIRKGDRLPDGSIVEEIRSNGVRIDQRGKKLDLAFTSGAAGATRTGSERPQQIQSVGFQ